MKSKPKEAVALELDNETATNEIIFAESEVYYDVSNEEEKVDNNNAMLLDDDNSETQDVTLTQMQKLNEQRITSILEEAGK